jgi:hypothetical protein
MPDELKQFLSDVQADDTLDPFAEVPNATGEPEDVEGDDEDEESKPRPRNRRERRLQERLEAERRSSIALAEKLEAITTSQKERQEMSDSLKAIERIYGTDSPEAREATEILRAAFLSIKEEATQTALQKYEERIQQEQSAVQEAESLLDSMVDELEDEFGIEMSQRDEQNFYKLLERMSPKDRDGNIVYYADHFAVWEQLQSMKQRPDDTAKQLASRSMTAGAGSDTKVDLQKEVTERTLREHGII